MNNLIITNATVSTPSGNSARKGVEMSNVVTIKDAAIVITDGTIDYCGPQSEMPQIDFNSYEVIDAKGNAVLPGFVDSHTHLIFGGYRPDEFEWRMKGDSYMSIMERGGGIQSTVNATRLCSVNDFVQKAQWFINRMSKMGVTTVEAKTGYGLDLESELKMIDAIETLTKSPEQKLRIVSTFLGAHAVPKEYKGRTAEYVDLIINEMLPAVKGKAKFCDIFTEKNVFEIEDSRRLLKAAREMGFELKLHADEIVTLGGAELAAELKATSADHLLHVSDKGVKDMAEAGVVATLLPLTAFTLKESYAPARKFIDSGTAVALATDLNPGSCFSGSIPLTIALACIYMNMSIEETITALTLNGAAALGIADQTGSLEKGKSGDVVILHFDNFRMLPYYVGMNCVKTVISKGKVVSENN
ncbi:MAG: imidazolonepropionase [Prevotella sp.]|nr:imidazolonepropionase [Bacteroides sp.]MCM1437156.1 imidazolonepropionase [Prevotella sp.]